MTHWMRIAFASLSVLIFLCQTISSAPVEPGTLVHFCSGEESTYTDSDCSSKGPVLGCYHLEHFSQYRSCARLCNNVIYHSLKEEQCRGHCDDYVRHRCTVAAVTAPTSATTRSTTTAAGKDMREEKGADTSTQWAVGEIAAVSIGAVAFVIIVIALVIAVCRIRGKGSCICGDAKQTTTPPPTHAGAATDTDNSNNDNIELGTIVIATPETNDGLNDDATETEPLTEPEQREEQRVEQRVEQRGQQCGDTNDDYERPLSTTRLDN